MARPTIEDPRNINITFRVNKKELKAINNAFEEQKHIGFKYKREFFRHILIHDSSTILKHYQEKANQKNYIHLQTYAYQLQKIGVNFNQIMRFINRDKTTSKLSFKDIKHIRTVLIQITELLENIKNDR